MSQQITTSTRSKNRKNPAPVGLRVLTQRLRVQSNLVSEGNSKNNKIRKQNKDPMFWWSVSDTNKHLPGKYWSLVADGIEKAAKRVQEPVHPADIAWVRAHGGRFQQHVPPNSKQGRRLAELKSHRNLSPQQLKAKVLSEKHICLEDSPRFSKAPTTIANYEVWMKHLWNFLAMVGDYESMLILLPNAEDRCPSMKVTSICLFVHHRFHLPGTSLKEKSKQIKCVAGGHMVCEGSIQNYRWFDSCFAAIKLVHRNCEHNGDYVAACPSCSKNKSPCRKHQGNQEFMCNKGNPTLAGKCLEIKEWLKKESINRGYTADHRSAFLPGDFVRMHELLCQAEFGLWDFQNYLMILLACHSGSRFDSYSSVQPHSFLAPRCHWVIKDGRVVNFAIRVREKTDKKDHDYRIHFEDTMPKRCLARHLLVFFHCLCISDGPIFLSKESLEKVQREVLDGHLDQVTTQKMQMSYSEFSNWMAWTVRQLDAANLANFGPHSPRGTKYLHDMLGGAHFSQSAETSRHESIKTAQLYFADAASVELLILEHPELMLKHRVPKFRDCLVRGDGTSNQRVSSGINGRTAGVETMQDLSRLFVEEMLMVPMTHPQYRDASFLLRRSYGMHLQPTTSGTNPENVHLQAIQNLPPEHRSCIFASFASYRQVMEKQVDSLSDSKKSPEKRSEPVMAKPSAPCVAKPSPPIALPIAPPPGHPGWEGCPSPMLEVVAGDDDGHPRYVLSGEQQGRVKKAKSKEDKVSLLCQLTTETACLPLAREPAAAGLGILARFKKGHSIMIQGAKSKDLERTRNFYRKCVAPFAKCFHQCHQAEKASFLRTYSGSFNIGNLISDKQCPRCTEVKKRKDDQPAAGTQGGKRTRLS